MIELKGWRAYSFYGLVIVLGALALAAIFCAAIFPYLPNEGDAFGCWFPYVQNWNAGGLAGALRGADWSGRYPGLAFIYKTIMAVTGKPYLDALVVGRALSLVLALTGFVRLGRLLQFRRLNILLASTALFLSPVFVGVLSTNTQDSFKGGLFLWAICFYLDLKRESKSKNRRRLKWLGFWFTATYLPMMRAVEFLPLAAFVFFSEYREVSQTRLIARLRESILRTARYLAVPIFFVFALHVYGKIIVGHWAVSGRGFANETFSWVYRRRVHDAWTAGGFFAALKQLISLPLLFYFNKVATFFQDFIFQGFYLSMVMVPVIAGGLLADIHFPITVYAWMLAAVFGLGYLRWIYLDRTLRRPETTYLLAAGAGAFFWIYGLSHYEPRYWLLVFVLLFIAFCIFMRERRQAPYVFTVMALVMVPMQIKEIQARYENHLATTKDAKFWVDESMPFCNRPNQAIAIPNLYYNWSAFKYFANLNCPSLPVYFFVDGRDELYPTPPPVGTVIHRFEVKDMKAP